tara:strand:- start:686 stop:937 length:252 start_codon:yes stop_codon:yes gene_type:complete
METSIEATSEYEVRSYHEIISSIDKLPVPPSVFDGEDQEAEDACVDHVKKQLLLLPDEEYDLVVRSYGFLEYAAWSLAGLEGC